MSGVETSQPCGLIMTQVLGIDGGIGGLRRNDERNDPCSRSDWERRRRSAGQLTAAGHKVRAMVRDPKKAAALAGPNVELVAGDFSMPVSLGPALKGAERAFMATPVDE